MFILQVYNLATAYPLIVHDLGNKQYKQYE